jgi:putative peptidoglycan binding protein
MAAEAFDADVVLGVATKATQVFAQDDDTFFSYPLAPLGFRQDDLRGMVSGATAEGRRALAEFSYLVNAIPSGPLWSPLPNGFLWEVYGDVLVSAQLAEATRSQAEEKAYEKAYSYLHDVHSDGSVTDSEAALSYRRYRDAWLVLAEQYKSGAAKAEASSDPEVGRRWREVVEPALREKQGEIERQWTTEGHRAEVEEARRVEEQLSQSSPAEAWARYRKLFDPSTPEIFFATDGDGGRYVPTSFRPSSALDGAWGQINLTREELTALAASAPAALRERLGASVDSGVQSLSFEYSSVAISRSWFSPDVFASRAWRLPDGAKPISEGDPESPAGRCPAYVAGLVLLRNLRVTQGPAVATLTAPLSASLGALHVGALRELAPLQMKALVADPSPAAAPADAKAESARLRPELLAALDRGDFERIAIELPPPATPPEGPPPSEAEQGAAPPGDELYVLGFVCKRVPKCPDPAPGLRWPDDKGPPWPGRELKQPPAMKGADVRKWQAQMKARGWSIAVDGVYDGSDDALCRQFQAEKGLEVDGAVGPVTWRAAWNTTVT